MASTLEPRKEETSIFAWGGGQLPASMALTAAACVPAQGCLPTTARARSPAMACPHPLATVRTRATVGSSSEPPLELRRARPSPTRRPRSPAPSWSCSPVPPWHPLRPPSNSLEQAAARGTSAATAPCWQHARPLQAFNLCREVAVRDSALAGTVGVYRGALFRSRR
jgi:hypothetical protein